MSVNCKNEFYIMSESLSSSLNRPMSLIMANSLEVNDAQLEINRNESSIIKNTNSNSIEQSSLSKNITNVIINNVAINETAINDIKLSTKNTVQRKYPFTEKSKREISNMIRMRHEKKSEQIKKFNEIIVHGAEVIKV